MTQTWPLITVRIPAYNHEQFIIAALESVRSQSYPNKEIVIIDDGSTDSTAEKIANWQAEHQTELPIDFRSRPNRGVVATINELIEMANGEFLVGLASDDLLLPDSLLVRYRYLNSHPNKLAVFGDSQVIDGSGNIVFESGLEDLHSAKKSRYVTDEGLRKELIQRWSVTGSVIMTRRDLHQVMRYDERLQVEDRDFYLQMAAKNILGFVDHPVAAYRVHGKNTCFDNMSGFSVSANKFRTLKYNIHRFSYRDQLLFVWPLISSLMGMAFHGLSSFAGRSRSNSEF